MEFLLVGPFRLIYPQKTDFFEKKISSVLRKRFLKNLTFFFKKTILGDLTWLFESKKI